MSVMYQQTNHKKISPVIDQDYINRANERYQAAFQTERLRDFNFSKRYPAGGWGGYCKSDRTLAITKRIIRNSVVSREDYRATLIRVWGCISSSHFRENKFYLGYGYVVNGEFQLDRNWLESELDDANKCLRPYSLTGYQLNWKPSTAIENISKAKHSHYIEIDESLKKGLKFCRFEACETCGKNYKVSKRLCPYKASGHVIDKMMGRYKTKIFFECPSCRKLKQGIKSRSEDLKECRKLMREIKSNTKPKPKPKGKVA